MKKELDLKNAFRDKSSKIKSQSCMQENPYIFTRLNSEVASAPHRLKKREAPTFPKNSDASCPKLNCKSTPDWTIGVMCALVVLAALQLLMIVYVAKKNKPSGYNMQEQDGSYSSYSL